MNIVSIKAPFIEHKNLEESLLKGIVELTGGNKVEVTLEPDEEDVKEEIFQLMVNMLKDFLMYLTPEKQREYRQIITDGIMEEVYSQSDEDVNEENILNFYEDLHITRIAVYPDTFVIWYEVQGEDLIMQINMPGYEIDEFYFVSL